MSARTRGGRRRRERVERHAGERIAQRASCRYSGRKSWPHWLMQCASSIGDVADAARWRAAQRSRRAPSPTSALGRDVQQPAARPRAARPSAALPLGRRFARCAGSAAATPCATRPSTWSFISAMSGEMTSASDVGLGLGSGSTQRRQPGSTATCRRRSAGRRASRGRRARLRSASRCCGRKYVRCSPQYLYASEDSFESSATAHRQSATRTARPHAPQKPDAIERSRTSAGMFGRLGEVLAVGNLRIGIGSST